MILYKVVHMLGTHVAETILASGHVRPHTKAAHMEASDLIKNICKNHLQLGAVRKQPIQTARVRRAHFGRIDEENRVRSTAPSAPRSRTFTRLTGTGPIPVWMLRSGA